MKLRIHRPFRSKAIVRLAITVAILALCLALYFFFLRDTTVLVARLQTPQGIMTFTIPRDLVWQPGFEAREDESVSIGIEMMCIFPSNESGGRSGEEVSISICGSHSKLDGEIHDANEVSEVSLTITLAPNLRDPSDPLSQSPRLRMLGDELREGAPSDVDGTNRFDIYWQGEKTNYSVYRFATGGNSDQSEPQMFCQDTPTEFGTLHCFFDYPIGGAFVTTSFDRQKKRYWKQIYQAVRSEVPSFQQAH